MQSIYLINTDITLSIIFSIALTFVILGVFYSKKFSGLNNYLLANKSINTFSLTTSFTASILGTWILFGPSSAATWGGIGAVIGYALGTAFPFFLLIYLGKKFRKDFPDCITITEVIRLKFNQKIFKLILFLSVFYMIIFLIAEVTAVSLLINYISGIDLWITAAVVITSSLIYTLYGGLRASIFTDKFQFIFFIILLSIGLYFLISLNSSIFNYSFIKQNKPDLLSWSYLPNFTSGIIFFIAVAATNLFHQGNWQRVYAAKNYKTLQKSLIYSFIIVIPIVFIMGFTGLIAISENAKVTPDLAFFYLLLKNNSVLLGVIIIFLGISLTISSVDTLINAISSIVIVDAKKLVNLQVNNMSLSRILIVLISIISFYVASKGISILYLFLLADMLCCSAVVTIFYSFFKKKINLKHTYFSIILGLVGGTLFFPSPDFNQSLLIGGILPVDIFPVFISSSLLFFSFITATILPYIFLKIKGDK